MAGQLQMTYGLELEWSDIDRKVDIPEDLGSWEGPKIAGYYMGSEIDIVNTKGKWKGVGTDPLCVTCKVGGEIHTKPSETIDTQLIRMMRILDLFNVAGVACPNHGHIHVGFKTPDLMDSIECIKNIFAYTERNQEDLIIQCCGYDQKEHDLVRECPDLEDWVKQYLIVGDGKYIPPELFRAVEEAETAQDIQKALLEIKCLDWDPFEYKESPIRKTENSHRTAVNLFNLTKGNTIEFRIFRASINPVEVYSCLRFVQRYMEEAVKGVNGKLVLDILKEGNFKFPKLNFDAELAKGWQNTRQTKGRCGPFKKYTGVLEVSEDPILQKRELEGMDQGLKSILDICKLDFEGKTVDDLK